MILSIEFGELKDFSFLLHFNEKKFLK